MTVSAGHPGESDLAQMAARLERVNRALRTLSGSNRALLGANSEAELFETVCRVVADRSGYLGAWIGRAIDDAEKTFQVVAHAGVMEEYVRGVRVSWGDTPWGSGPTGRAVRTGKPVAVQNVATNPDVEPWRERLQHAGIGAVLALPLMVYERPVGALTIFAADPHAFDGEALELLEETAADVSFGIRLLGERADKDRMEQRIHWLAYHDAMTEMPNRHALVERVRSHLAANTALQPFVVLSFVLLNAGMVADVLGLGTRGLADMVIQLANRMRDILPAASFLARTAVAQFAVMLPQTEVRHALALIDEHTALLGAPTTVQDIQVDISISIGVAAWPDHGNDAEDLVRRADAAMRYARRTNRHHAVYEPAIEDASHRTLLLVGGIRTALAERQFLLHFQPKVSLPAGRPMGAEALIRWPHPEHGMISPGTFIPVAEQTGLIGAVTDWVLNDALRAMAAWSDHQPPQRLSVNMTARSFFDASLPDKLAGLLATNRVSAHRLVLELTESALMEDPEAAVAILIRLREMGVEIAIDDFGTGYSSLSYLQKFPVDEIKLDHSFVRAALADPVSRRIVKAIVGLGHDLGRRIVAEGVETSELADLMYELGCDKAQGYYFARPMPEADYIAWLRASVGAPSQ